MTINPSPRVVGRRGMTLLELTTVILVLLALVAITFVGASTWKRGSNRAACIMTLRNMQIAARSYQNLYGYKDGARPCAEYGTQDIAVHLHMKGYIDDKLFYQSSGVGHCPDEGGYTCPLPDIFPEQGVLYMNCSLASIRDHLPASHDNW